MINESASDEARALWQSQPPASRRVLTKAMRTRVTKVDALMHRATLAIVVGGSVGILELGWLMKTFPSLLARIGALIVLIAILLQVRLVLGLVTSTRATLDTLGVTPSLIAYRAVLERQRRFHGSAGAWWRLAAWCAGGMTFLAGVAQPRGWDRETILTAALWVALAAGVFVNGLLQAGRYEKEIDEIDHLQLEQP